MGESALSFADRAAWRAWLDTNHATASEAVVFLSKKAVPHGLHYLEALEEALCFGWIDGRLRAHDAERFVLRFTPRRADSIWSEANRDRVQRLMREGRMMPAGLASVRAARESGAWQRALRPSRKPRMPADLGKALRANATAWARFRSWGNSFQAQYIYWVLEAKKDETRRRRIARVVERASRDKRPGVE